MVNISETYLILKANLFSLITIFSVLFLSKTSYDYSRTIILLFFILNAFLPIPVYFIKRFFLRFPFLRADIFVVCDNNGYENIKKWFLGENAFGFDVKEIIDIDNLTIEQAKDKIDRCLEDGSYHAAVIAINRYSPAKIYYFIDHIQRKISRIIVLPKISTLPLFNAEVINSINHKGLAFFVKNNLLNPVDKTFKTVFDITLALILTLVFSPLLIIIYLAIFITTGNNPVFRQKRIGKEGKEFDIYKFKTMVENADEILKQYLEQNSKAKEEYEKYHKLKDDPRITKIGKFLRRTSLDELPQLINILKGEMSLIGPRPILPNEISKFGEYFEYYKAVKPGITGLWQVSGRNELDFYQRIRLDVWYVRNWSIELDFLILLKTILIVLSRKGSY